MAGNVYSGLSLDGSKIRSALEGIGATNVTEELNKDGANSVRFAGTYNAKPFLIRVYLVKGGTYTLGYASGYDRDTFNEIADAICAKCRVDGGPQYNVSASKRPEADFADLCSFLVEQGAKVVEQGSKDTHQLQRLEGPQRDRLVIKYYANGTLQVQGRHAHLAVLVNDFFSNVLSLDELIAKYNVTYQVQLTSKDVSDELTASLAGTVQVVGETIRKQLSSALALTKINLPLEDFGAVAFPALRALEGVMYQTLGAHKVIDVSTAAHLGDYFSQSGAKFNLTPVVRGGLTNRVATFLEDAYTLWNTFRHPLFHMDVTPDTSVSLTKQRAAQIVQEVFILVEKNHDCLIAT